MNASISRLETPQTCGVKAWLTYHPDSPAFGRVRPRWEDMPVQDWGPAEKGQFIHYCIEEIIKMKNIAGVIPVLHKWCAKDSAIMDVVTQYVYSFTKAMEGVTATCRDNGWVYKNVVMSGIWKRSHGDLTQGGLAFWCKPEWCDTVIAVLQSVFYVHEQGVTFYHDAGVTEEDIHCDANEVHGIIDFHNPVTGIVVDFKSGYKPWTPKQVACNNQLMMYSLLFHKKTSRYPEKVGIFSVEQGQLVMVDFDPTEFALFYTNRLHLMKRSYAAVMAGELPDMAPVAAGLSGSAAFCPCDVSEYCPYV